MKRFDDNTFDACVTDPPYELSNDGKASASRVFAEFMFPENSKLKPDTLSEFNLDSLAFEVLNLCCGGSLVNPSPSMPIGTVTLDNDSTLFDNNIENACNSPICASCDDACADVKTKTTKHVGCFALELADREPAIDIIASSGAGFSASGFWVGFGICDASLPSLLRRCFPVIFFGDNVRLIDDALSHAIGASAGAEMQSMLDIPNMGNATLENASTLGTLKLLVILKLSGAKLIRTSPAASGLSSKLKPITISVVNDSADRALSFDVIVHEQNIRNFGFMGKGWDGQKIAYNVELWREIYRVLKPGAHLLSFGGTRTYHRMACAIEDAGFEVRDMCQFLYGSGFPKNHDIAYVLHKKAQTLSEHDLRFVRASYLQEAVYACKECGQVLLSCLSEQGASQRWRAWPQSESARSKQPCLEGWHHLETPERELYRCQICSMSHGLLADGSKGWIHNGAQACNGEALGENAKTDRGCASYKSQSVRQQDREFDAVSIERRAQAIRGQGTALKPSNEPICVARKPLIGTVAENVLQFGCGGLNIDAGRIGDRAESPQKRNASDSGIGNGKLCYGTRTGIDRNYSSGRWPANVLLDEEVASMLDAQSGVLKSGSWNGQKTGKFNTHTGPQGKRDREFFYTGDSGGASRFFYTAKASKREREAGLDGLEDIRCGAMEGNVDGSMNGGKPIMRKNFHPTVKPIDLMEYLIKLVTPPNGHVLDPFAGSGTTGCAAARLGFEFTGIELDAKHAEIAEARIKYFSCDSN